MASFGGARHAKLLVAALILQGCDGADDDPTGNAGSFNIAVSPTTLSVAQGATGSVTVTLVRGGGFNGVVTLGISGAPTGVSATMDPAQLSGATTQSRIDFTVSGTATPGTTTVTVTATSGGQETTASFLLTTFPAPNYTLSLTPAALTLAAGTSGSATVSIQRSNFTGNVAIEILDAPSGITWGITPTPTDPNSWSLNIAVGASMLPGNYPLTVRGGGFGAPERFAVFQLTVTPAPSGGAGLEYSFCDPVNAPVYFAYQDGTGAWQRVAAVTAGGVVRFPFNLVSNLGGVMAVYRVGVGIDFRLSNRYGAGGRAHSPGVPATNWQRRVEADIAAPLVETFITEVAYATKPEFIQEAAESCAQSFPTKTVSGTIAGVAPGQYAVVSLGESGTIFDGAGSTNRVTFEGVKSGLIDFFGTRIVTPGLAPDRAVVFRNLNPADNGSLPQVIDFNGAASFQPAVATVTISGGQGDALEVYTGVHTTTTNGGFWNDLAPSTNATRPWAGLTAAKTVTGDFHSITVFASSPVMNNFRATVKYVGPVSNQSIAFGSIANAAATSLVSGGAYPRYRFQGTLPAEYNKGVGFIMSPETEGNSISAYVSSAYLAATGSATAYDITMPDVAGLAGFPAASRLTPGTNSVTTDAFGFTGAGVFNVKPALGNDFKASVRTTTVVVP